MDRKSFLSALALAATPLKRGPSERPQSDPCFDIREFGALVDGRTDDTGAWQHALRTAAQNGGVVQHPGGISVVGDPLVVPDRVAIEGVAPRAILKAGARIRGPVLSLGAARFAAEGYGSRFSRLSGITIDGSSMVDVGLALRSLVQTSFERLTVLRCSRYGVIVDACQNCLFESINIEYCGTELPLDAGLLMDGGAGNNVFVRCEFNRNATSGVLFRASVPSQEGAFATGPSDNLFLGCVLENADGERANLVYHRAGRNNVFERCDLSIGASGQIGVRLDQGDANLPGVASHLLRLSGCRLSGRPDSGTLLSLQGAYRTCLTDCFLESASVGIELDDGSDVQISGYCHIAGINTPVRTTGARAPAELVGSNVVYAPLRLSAGSETISIDSLAGNPEGRKGAPAGSLVLDTLGIAWYQKRTRSGSTGWGQLATLSAQGELSAPGGAVFAGAALQPTASSGFVYLPVSTAPPQGVPRPVSGGIPIVFDDAGALWAYVHDEWRVLARVTSP